MLRISWQALGMIDQVMWSSWLAQRIVNFMLRLSWQAQGMVDLLTWFSAAGAKDRQRYASFSVTGTKNNQPGEKMFVAGVQDRQHYASCSVTGARDDRPGDMIFVAGAKDRQPYD